MNGKEKLIASASVVFAISAVGLVAEPAFAQSAGSETASSAPSLDEVVVTARRREESLISVPVSVSVMTDSAIQETRVADLDELAAYTPGMISAPQVDRTQNRLVFRGLSTSFGQVFIDGAPYTGTNSPDLTDVARVEVLGGPQSVYFGRSTFAGAVNFVTRKPGNTFSGHASAGFSNYNGNEEQISGEGPIIPDVLGVRVSARNYQFGGQYTSFYSGAKLGERSTKSVSVALATISSSPLQLSGYYSFARDDDGAPEAASLRVVGPGPILNCNLGGTGGPYWCGALPNLSGLDPRQIGDNTVLYPQVQRYLINNETNYPLLSGPGVDSFGLVRDVHHLHGRADYSFDSGWQIAALSAYSRTRSSRLYSPVQLDTSTTPNTFAPTDAARAAACATAPPGPICYRPQFVTLAIRTDQPIDDFSVETRVSSPQSARLRGVAGVSFFKIFNNLPGGLSLTNLALTPNAGGGGIDSGSRTPAVFGGLYFDATDRLTVSGEARYQWDKIARQPVYPVVTDKLESTFTSFSPRVTVDYKIAPTSMLYADFARGYRPGGFNAALTTLTASQRAEIAQVGSNITYEQEMLDSFEVGHKATWLDQRLRTTAAVYYMKWTNGQVSNSAFYTTATGGGTAITVISNIGRVDLKGAEFTGEFAATRKLTIGATVDYNDSDIKTYVYSPNGQQIRGTSNVQGNKLDQVSKIRATFSPAYRVEFGGNWSANARVDYQYRSKYFVDPTNEAFIKARSLVNTRVEVSKGKFSVEGYVHNLFNDDTLIQGAKLQDAVIIPNPAVPCPPCFTAAAPPLPAGIPGNLNKINLGLPEKRIIGMSASVKF